MGNRRGAGRAGFAARLARWIVTGIAVFFLAAGLQAEQRLRPLDQHATVLNGLVVGSAFLIQDGIAVTNRHVVAGLRRGDTVILQASRPQGATITARLLALSPRMDLALLQVPEGFLPRVAAENAPERPGLAVTAAGIDASQGGPGPRLEVDGTVLTPRQEISAFGPGLIARLPGARPGFSGGPLFDRQGRLAGMVTAIRPAAGIVIASSGTRSRRARDTVDAFALRAAEVRAEVRRLLALAGS